MLDDKDIVKLIEVFATREAIVTKQDFLGLKEDFNDLKLPLMRTHTKQMPIFKKW